MNSHTVAAPAVWFAALYVPVLAQEPRSPAQPVFRAEVNLVDVVAVVTGEDNLRVEGR